MCIHARAGQTLKTPNMWDVDSEIVCMIEVGLPISNEDRGYISLRQAQEFSALVANEAAYSVLLNHRGITASICRDIILRMDRDLRAAVAGARVNQCGTTKYRLPVPVVRWP